MLVLTRRVGESIMIGEDVVISILGKSRGGQVRLGVSAPEHIAVHREEIYDRIMLAKKRNNSGVVTQLSFDKSEDD